MQIFGKNIGREELLAKIGDIDHLGGVRSFIFNDGPSKDIRAFNVRNASGISLNILLDRGMDIPELFYKEIPISFTTPIRSVSPYFFDNKGDGFLRSFFGGFLTTCGITYMGEPCVDKGEELGLHGRISNTPAENVFSIGEWKQDNYRIIISGKMRDTKLYGNHLELQRTFTIPMDEPKIYINDVIENIGFRTSPVMILYHFNFSYPLLDKESELVIGKSKVTPSDYGDSKKDLKKHNRFSEPIENLNAQVFFHDIEPDEKNYCNVALINKLFNNGHGIGVWLRYDESSLPYLIQWKHLERGEYVCGLEPANSLVRGRSIEREKGTLKFLKPGEKLSFNLEMKILETNSDIEKFIKKYC